MYEEEQEIAVGVARIDVYMLHCFEMGEGRGLMEGRVNKKKKRKNGIWMRNLCVCNRTGLLILYASRVFALIGEREVLGKVITHFNFFLVEFVAIRRWN